MKTLNFQTLQTVYEISYDWATQLLNKQGVNLFNPEYAFRRFVIKALTNNSYHRVVMNYGNFLIGQLDALEDFDPDSDFGNQFSDKNPVIEDLIQILITLQLHQSSKNYLVPYRILSSLLLSQTRINDEIYVHFLLQILEKLKFITVKEAGYFITTLGIEFLKKKDFFRIEEFFWTFKPKYPIVTNYSGVLKNPKISGVSKIRKIK